MQNWYTTVNHTEALLQGDILYSCPVFFPDKDVNYAELPDPTEIELNIGEMNVIVMTQSCDLQACSPDKPVLLCPLGNLGSIKTSNLDNLRRDKIINLHLLNVNSQEEEEPKNYFVIDFSTVYTLPYGTLMNWVNSKEHNRARLMPPYLEHMSQRFAMTFMRVGTDDASKIALESLKAAKTSILQQASSQ